MSEEFMKMGASDRFFYYALTGRSTIDIITELSFREPFDLPAMKKAAAYALRCIPEFNKSIVLQNGRPEAVVGSGDIVFMPEVKDKPVKLCSDETNGLLFYFRYTERRLVFSAFHGLTDGAGMASFVRLVMYFYMKEKGIAITPEEEAAFTKGRTVQGIPPDADPDDVYMPYEKYGDATLTPEWSYENPGAFAIPETPYPEECDYIHLCRIKLPLAEINKLKSEAGVSYLPLLADVISSAVANTFDCGEKPVVVMSGIDQRQEFGSQTFVNCSDSVFLPYTAELRGKGVRERCAGLKAAMKQQFEPALHRKMAGDKVLTVRELEKDPAGAAAVAKRLELLPSGDNFTPMTYVLTFIGDQSMGEAADTLLDNVMIYNTARACFAIIGYYGDTMTITVGNRSDSSAFAGGIAGELQKRGVNAGIVSDSHFYSDKFHYETIRTVNESEEQS